MATAQPLDVGDHEQAPAHGHEHDHQHAADGCCGNPNCGHDHAHDDKMDTDNDRGHAHEHNEHAAEVKPTFVPSPQIFFANGMNLQTRGRLRILYGSQTGCAEEVAQRIVAEAVRQRYEVTCGSMEEFDVQNLPNERLIIFVASTTGEGEVPENMRAFWRFMLRKDLPLSSLSRVTHACFGLGDSSYPKFNFAIKRLHRRLEQLGSKALVPLGLGDDQDALGIDQELTPWLTSLMDNLGEYMPLPPRLKVIPTTERPKARYTLEAVSGHSVSASATSSSSSSKPPATHPASKTHPFPAKVVTNERLTKKGCGRDVHHIELDVTGWGVSHQPGDALAVRPRNPPELTRALVIALGFDPAAKIKVVKREPHAPQLPSSLFSDDDKGEGWTTVLELFSTYLDAFGVPRRPFFSLLSHFAGKDLDKERLLEFAAAEGAADLREYATKPRRTYAEVLLDFPTVRPPLEYYLDLIPPLRERYFSIASSPLTHPNRVHITVAIVRYKTYLAEPRFGVCSTFLEGLQPGSSSSSSGGNEVMVWLRKGCLTLPASPSCAMIMIGPGTGVAPFRSFVQTRQAMRQSGVAVGPAHLFFGCRRPDHDYLYETEWQQHVANGDLTGLHTAFSRLPDGQPKVYVQTKMVEPAVAAQLWTLLREPTTHVYIAGAANQMPKGVRKALEAIAMSHGGLDEAAAGAFVQQLDKGKRLQCETW